MAFHFPQIPQCFGAAFLVLLIVWPSNSAGRSSMTNERRSSLFDSISYQALKRRHESWIKEYDRRYDIDAEKAERFEIFKENVKFIDPFNKENHKLSLKANKFADLTREEFTKTYTSRARRLSSYYRWDQPSLSANSTPQPSSIDWREKGAVTGVKDQGPCGCCWAFAAVAAIEGIIQIETGKLVSLSEQELLDCVPPRNGSPSLCDGGFVRDAFDFVMKNASLTTDLKNPYKGVPGACNFHLNSASDLIQEDSGVRIKAFVPVIDDEMELLKAVARQPVSVSVTINISMFSSYPANVLGEIFCGPDGEPNHSMAVVGYGTENGTDYWLLKNSYGDEWREDGYVKMARGVNGGICGITKSAFYPIID